MIGPVLEVEYKITKLALPLSEPLGAMLWWAERHLPEVRAAQ